MTEAPSGTVTFLFTDLVGSTELLDKLGDDEAERLRQTHFQLLREAVAGRHGQEVKNLGDGLMVAFASAVDALACAVAMQEAVLLYNQGPVEHRLEVRIGLHVGEPVRDEDDYFGTAVVVAKRLCDSALGGRILVSDLVRGLVGSRGGYAFRNLGPLPLKGFAEPLPACEVVWLPGGQLEAEARGLRKLWTSKLVRIAAAVVLLAVIGGGVVGGMFVSGAVGGSGSPAGAEYRELDIHVGRAAATYQSVSGDCQSSDLILRGVFGEPAVVSGDFAGHYTEENEEAIVYLSDSCQWGFNTATFTLTDQSGNTLSGATQNTSNLVGYPGEGPRAEINQSADIITGGTGIYQGATGHGRCNVKGTTEPSTENPTARPGAVALVTEEDCTYQVTPGGVAPADAEPVILELGAGVTRMTVFASSVALPKKAYFSVQYFNPRDQTHTGLSLKLRAPKGTEMRAATRDERQPPAGERVWALPDLAPGALGRLEFSVTFLSAKNKTVDLVAEIAGDGFDQAVRSDPLQIEIVQ